MMPTSRDTCLCMLGIMTKDIPSSEVQTVPLAHLNGFLNLDQS